MLLPINLSADAVLALVDVPPLLRSELAAIRSAIRRNAAIDALFAVLGTRCFARRHLTAPDALGDAVLLILAALSHLVVAVVRLSGVVLVSVDGPAQAILLAVDLPALLRRESPAIARAVALDLTVQARFARFEALRFASGQLARLDPICNPVLLILAAVVHRAFSWLLGGLLGKHGRRGEQGGQGKQRKCASHLFLSSGPRSLISGPMFVPDTSSQ